MLKRIDYKKLQHELFLRTEGYALDVRLIYTQAMEEIISLVKDTKLVDGKPFSFSAYGYGDRTTAILRSMYSRVYQTIREGVKREWLLSNKNNDELVKSVFGKNAIGDKHFARYFQHNMSAMDAFFERKQGSEGLSLSQKVWKYTGLYKQELENSLDLALGEGTPANKLATKIKGYLQDPDRFYRRFRVKIGEDKEGKPVYGGKWKRRIWDKESESYKWIDDNPKKFQPGRGVYRSSYRNAQRLARTETNIAYRSADFERWQQLDFVIGVEVKLSNNHTLNGKPFHDICDELAGVYPVGFKFTGWHACCRCYSVPVLAEKAELDRMLDDILSNKAYKKPDAIANTPYQFNSWMQENADRYQAARERGTLPYFIIDNQTWIKK